MKKTYFPALILLCALFFLSASTKTDAEHSISSSKNAIKRFKISGKKGVIRTNEKTISIVISETDFTALVPTIKVSKGASVSPASGVAQDFTEPVTYTVTGKDGTTAKYIVTVSTNTIEFTYNDKKYEIVRENKTWSEAASIAARRGGYLVEINDQAEQNAIFSQLDEKAGIDKSRTRNEFLKGAVWLGGHDQTLEGNWMWDGDNDRKGQQFWRGGLTGFPVENRYNNWGNEPDNFENQDGLSLSLERTLRNAKGEWNDLDRNTKFLFFIIEYD